MGKVSRYNSETGETMKGGEMKLLNMRLKMYLDCHPEKSKTERALSKYLNNPEYQVFIVGIDITDNPKDKDTFTLAIFKPGQNEEGVEEVACRYLQGGANGDLTHYHFDDQFSEYEDLPESTREEVDAVYSGLFTQSEEYFAEESQSETVETQSDESEDDSHYAHM